MKKCHDCGDTVNITEAVHVSVPPKGPPEYRCPTCAQRYADKFAAGIGTVPADRAMEIGAQAVSFVHKEYKEAGGCVVIVPCLGSSGSTFGAMMASDIHMINVEGMLAVALKMVRKMNGTEGGD